LVTCPLMCSHVEMASLKILPGAHLRRYATPLEHSMK